MYKSVNRISVFKCLTNDGLTFTPRTTSWIQIYRCSSGLMPKNAEQPVDISCETDFSSVVQHRQKQARRSFFAKAQSMEDCQKLLSLCERFGSVISSFHCEHKDSHLLLVEMNKEKNLKDLMEKVPEIFSYNKQIVKCNKEVKTYLHNVKGNNVKCNFVSATVMSSKKLLNTELSKRHNNLGELMKKCYEYLSLGELEIRKKFIMCRQVEVLCSGFLPGAVAFPFGSSVSGFGIVGCDLDMVLLPPGLSEDSMNFFSMEKSKIHLGIIYDVLKNFSSVTNDITYIKHARVPIVKYRDSATEVDCDLSIYNPHGVAMSQMLYILASFDWRIKALVIFTKLWSLKVGIATKVPGQKLSSFSVCSLVLFFLQQIQMLPPFEIFPCKDMQYLLKKDELILESVLVQEKQKCTNCKSVEELFKMFLEFYKLFDFEKWGISLRKGAPIKNPEKYSLYIENPIYPGLNVSGKIRPVDVFEIKDIFNLASGILNDKENDEEQIRRIFTLSVKKKIHMDFGIS